MKLTTGQRRLRVVIKRWIYSQLYLRESFRLMLGRAKPLVSFKVEASPPSIYFNFELDPDRVAELRESLELPFDLVPIRCLADEAPFHCITLNVYRVSGLANGLRAEWSLYVADAEGVPRYLIVEARSDSRSLDPIDLLTPRSELRHALVGEALETTVSAAEGGRFRARCSSTRGGEAVRIAPEWIEANDFIYWRNGVCDRTFYDSGLANPRARRLDPDVVEIDDDTGWGALAARQPRHVVIFDDAIEFAMSPWWNLG